MEFKVSWIFHLNVNWLSDRKDHSRISEASVQLFCSKMTRNKQQGKLTSNLAGQTHRIKQQGNLGEIHSMFHSQRCTHGNTAFQMIFYLRHSRWICDDQEKVVTTSCFTKLVKIANSCEKLNKESQLGTWSPHRRDSFLVFLLRDAYTWLHNYLRHHWIHGYQP